MKKTISIEGMSCNHCVMHVTHALNDLPGVTDVKVSLKENQAQIDTTDSVQNQSIIDAIEDAGYSVTKIE